MTDAQRSALDTLDCELRGLTLLRDAMQGPLATDFTRAVECIVQARGRVIVTGVGKSGHVARKIAATLSSTGTPSHFVHPSDASHGDLGMVRADDVVLALSWSGESAELSDIVAHTRRFSVQLIACTGDGESTLAKAADVVMTLPECVEACADVSAPTTSALMQMALGDALAISLVHQTNFSAEQFHTLHPGGRLGARLLRVRTLMHTGEDVPLIGEGASLSEAIVRMTGGRFGITGVVNAQGALVGAITDGDLRRAFASGFQDREATAVMGRSPRTISPDELAQTALARMNSAGITSLFVVENSAVVGILHVHDLLRAGLV